MSLDEAQEPTTQMDSRPVKMPHIIDNGKSIDFIDSYHKLLRIGLQFNKAVEDVKNLKDSPGNDDLLEIYALFKQANIGDCNTEKPGMFYLKEKAKWEAWNGKKGLSQEDAKKAYVEKVAALIQSIGLK